MPFKQRRIAVTKVPEEPVMLNTTEPVSIIRFQYSICCCIYVCIHMYVSLLPKGTVMCLSLLNTCIFTCIYSRTQEHLGSQETKRGYSRATVTLWPEIYDLPPWCREATLFPLFSASWRKSVQQEQMWPFDQSPSENKQLPWQPENTMWDMNWPLRLSLMLQDLQMYACLWCRISFLWEHATC